MDPVLRHIRGSYRWSDGGTFSNESRRAVMYHDGSGWWISPSSDADSAWARGPDQREPPPRWYIPISATQVHPDVRLTRKVEQVEGYLSSSSAASDESPPPTSPFGAMPTRLLFAKQQDVRDILFRQQMWPVFVSNIPGDTTLQDIRKLFGFSTGFASWKFAVQTDRAESDEGASGDFGFAEFKTPEGALEAIKKIDGIKIRGRKLRLRWAENAPTTPEVDDFYRAPERYKTSLCWEVFQKGLPCPRPGNCPYAHSASEIRHPRDDEDKPEAKTIDPGDVGDRLDSLDRETNESSQVREQRRQTEPAEPSCCVSLTACMALASRPSGIRRPPPFMR